jgi:hypothetical protein
LFLVLIGKYSKEDDEKNDGKNIGTNDGTD